MARLRGRRREDARTQLEQPLQVRGVAPDLRDQPVHDLHREGRGEHLDDPAAGDAEEAVLLAVVGGPHDDLVTLGDHVVDRPPLPHATDVVEQHAQALPAGGQVRRPALHRPCRADQCGHRADVAVADQVQEPDRESLVRGQGVGRGRAGHRRPPRSFRWTDRGWRERCGGGSGSDAHPVPGPT